MAERAFWRHPARGGRARLDDAAYTQYRQSKVRADRDSMFRAFWRAHRQFEGTFGATLNAQLQAIDLLKEAGVDMTTSAPFLASIKEMNSVMDEMDKLLR